MSESETPAHSRFGGSKAERWMNCAGAPAFCDTVPPVPSSKYAAEGTAAHAVGENCLRENIDAEEHLGRMMSVEGSEQSFLVDKGMVAAVQIYLDAVRKCRDEDPGCVLLIEEKFTFKLASAADDEVFGANDAMVYNPVKKKMTVFDYKHGAGMSVDATDNKQLKFYAAGAALSHPDWPIAEVEIVIVQPRARDADEQEETGIKRWAMDPMDLLEFNAEIEAAVAAAKVPGAPLTPGPWCKKTFCEGAATCPARQQQAMHEATLDFQNVEVIKPKDLPIPRDLDTARLGRMLLGFDILEGWIQQVRDYSFGLLQSGVPIPGWKLVDKMGRRHWIEDEQKIADYLQLMYGLNEDDVRPRKLATITEVERQLKAAIAGKKERKEALDDVELAFTLKESSGQTMAPDSDKRDAVNAAERDFGTVQTL